MNGGRDGPRTPPWVLRAAEWIGMHAPRAVGLRAGEAALRLQMRRDPAQREVVARNLAQVLGHEPGSPLVERAVRECYRLYGRYWYETFALRTMPLEELDRRFRLEGLENIDRALEGGRGMVLALPHMGNWDAAGHWFAARGYRMNAVAEQLKPRAVFDLFLRHRRALGIGILPLADPGTTGPKLVQLLARNEIVGLVADRDLTGRGVVVEMFGRPRRLPAGPAYLALATGAPLACAAVFTAADGWRCRVEPPLEIERTGQMRADVAALTRVVAERFERFIASAPADWHMLQPAWDDDLEEQPGAGDADGGRPGSRAGAASP